VSLRQYLLATSSWLLLLVSLAWLMRLLLARAGWHAYASLTASSHTPLPGSWLQYGAFAIVVLTIVFGPPALAIWLWTGVRR